MFDTGLAAYWEPTDCAESRGLIDGICEVSRAENIAVARRLGLIGELFELRRRERGEERDWVVDTWAAVGAEVAAALRISLAMAGSYMHYARAMRDRLPKVAAVFLAGDIDYECFKTMVFRTDLIEDDDTLGLVDAQLAVAAPRWPSMTRGNLSAAVDRIVARVDTDAVRRRKERVRDREIVIWEGGSGLYELAGAMFAHDGAVLDERLDQMAATVCAADPRTREQRRADALGALALGRDRLGCRCGTGDCPAGGAPPAANVVIHVIAEQATVAGRSDNPGHLIGSQDPLIPAEVIAELAAQAKLRPLVYPDTKPEPGYRPSRALADYVRCRDLTCRAPGCDRPATHCDIDHTIAYADGGATHASNLKCLCRFHHLLKTFWGWRDKQLPDGTIIWTLPSGQTYVTTPGSALLFPTLCAPTGELSPPDPARADRQGDPTVMMPRRANTRAQNRTRYVTTERLHNRQARRAALSGDIDARAAPPDDDEPPPF